MMIEAEIEDELNKPTVFLCIERHEQELHRIEIEEDTLSLLTFASILDIVRNVAEERGLKLGDITMRISGG